MVKSQYVGPLQIALALVSAAIGATIVGTQAASGNLRLNSPAFVLGILFLGPPAIALAIKVTTWLLALLRTSTKFAELQTVKIHDTMAAWTAHTAQVQKLRRSYKTLKAELVMLHRRDVCALHAVRQLPEELRQVVLELVRGDDYAKELQDLQSAVDAARLAWLASKRALKEQDGEKTQERSGLKRLGGVKEQPA